MFDIEGNNTPLHSAHGFFCGNDYPSTIQLVENANIRNGDWLTDTTTGHRYYAVDARPIIIDGKPSDWLVKYQTEQEYKPLHRHDSTTININAVNGTSVIGSQENVVLNMGNSLSDIEQLIRSLPQQDQSCTQELLNELSAMESSSDPALSKGSLAKFSDLLKKHTDLLSTIGGWAVQLLVGN